MEKNERLEALTSQNTELRRDIGLFGGMSIIGGIMIGSGIFYLGAYVLQRCGMNLGLTIARLRYTLGGDRPSQTTHQTLSWIRFTERSSQS